MKNDYLTQKKPLSALIVFALPMIVGNLFQQTYTMADSAIVGRLVGEDALAAVGAVILGIIAALLIFSVF